MIPQIIILCLLFGGLVLNAAKHGEDKGEYHIGWATLNLIATFLLLWWGGFFDCFGW